LHSDELAYEWVCIADYWDGKLLQGNLGWAYMQQSNFVAAEAVYRQEDYTLSMCPHAHHVLYCLLT
jgi:hypothetical protein